MKRHKKANKLSVPIAAPTRSLDYRDAGEIAALTKAGADQQIARISHLKDRIGRLETECSRLREALDEALSTSIRQLAIAQGIIARLIR